MRKLLPKLNSKGFTLVELLLVIVVITILATIGFTLYGNVARDARDTERRAEVDQIGKALETNRVNNAYQPLQNAWFKDNAIPADPQPVTRNYCIAFGAVNNTPPAAPIGAWPGACPAPYVAVNILTPAANSLNYRVCAWLENGTIFCSPNSQ